MTWLLLDPGLVLALLQRRDWPSYPLYKNDCFINVSVSSESISSHVQKIITFLPCSYVLMPFFVLMPSLITRVWSQIAPCVSGRIVWRPQLSGHQLGGVCQPASWNETRDTQRHERVFQKTPDHVPQTSRGTVHSHSHSRSTTSSSSTRTPLHSLLAFRRLFPVPAGRPAAEEPAEPASGGCGERDEPAERRQRSTALPRGRRRAESQRRVTPTGFRGPFPLYPY